MKAYRTRQMTVLTYKTYTGSVDVSVEDKCLHGKILFVDDLITYEADTVQEIQAAFESAVDRYLKYCQETGKSPNKPYSGTFNVRTGDVIHKKAAEMAHVLGQSLNEFVIAALESRINGVRYTEVKHTHIHNHYFASNDEDSEITMIASSTNQTDWGFMNATTH